MKHLPSLSTLLAIICLLGWSTVQAQDCDAYFPIKNGASFELTHYNAKEKVQSIVNTTISEKSHEGDMTTFVASASATDAKGKESNQFSYEVACGGGEFKMDMRAMGMATPVAGVENVEISIEADDMVFPRNLSVGMTLPDAHMNLKGTMNGMTIMNTNTTVSNRKVTASEKITTPAGTFSCIVIEEDNASTIMGMNIVTHSKSWYAVGSGLIRNESYKNGKLESYAVLTKLSGI
jgi:hypothetical protein